MSSVHSIHTVIISKSLLLTKTCSFIRYKLLLIWKRKCETTHWKVWENFSKLLFSSFFYSQLLKSSIINWLTTQIMNRTQLRIEFTVKQRIGVQEFCSLFWLFFYDFLLVSFKLVLWPHDSLTVRLVWRQKGVKLTKIYSVVQWLCTIST